MPEQKKPLQPNDPRSQAEKIEALARELECDESEEGFDERLRKIAPKGAPPSDLGSPRPSGRT